MVIVCQSVSDVGFGVVEEVRMSEESEECVCACGSSSSQGRAKDPT